MRHTYRVSFVGKHGLTTLTGILAILSTIIGGGIVSIPYSFISFGVPLAILFNILAVVMTVYSAELYLACKDIVPDKPESLYEIGYMVMGRSSIFMVGGVQFINSFGLMMVYFIIFGDTAGQLFANIFGSGAMDVWYYQRFFYVLLLAAALTPVILKKELAELEWLSFVLFGAIGIFIFINLYLLELAPDFNYVQQGFTASMLAPYPSPIRFISAVSITLVAYSYQFNLYPVYGSLQVKTN